MVRVEEIIKPGGSVWNPNNTKERKWNKIMFGEKEKKKRFKLNRLIIYVYSNSFYLFFHII